MLKSKNQRIKELLAENKLLKEENVTLKEQVCKCTPSPVKGAPKGRQCEVTTFDDSIPPIKTEGNVISKNDFLNL